MQNMKQALEERIQKLKQVIQEAERNLKNVPEGTVQVYRNRTKTQFYLRDNGKRKYLKNSESPLIQQLCRKDYNQRILKSAKKELQAMEYAYKNLPKKSCEDIYQTLNPARRSYIDPIWIPDEEYIRNWEQVEYEKKGFRDDSPEFYTNRGERVRSKTEILIANALQKHQIPYRYEYPVKLKQHGTLHPDFTVLNVRLRKEI